MADEIIKTPELTASKPEITKEDYKFTLDDQATALILALNELTKQLTRLVNK